MRNINNILTEHSRTSIFIAHRLRTVVEAGKLILVSISTWGLICLRFDHRVEGG
jgi:ABC-type transport system involved in Fe-S cluster assembly fused permease/ATPase subunit